jgi:hypothetical protein
MYTIVCIYTYIYKYIFDYIKKCAGNKQRSYKLMRITCTQHRKRRSQALKIYKRPKLGDDQAYDLLTMLPL